MLTTKAFAVDAMAARRATTENDFIVVLEDEGSGERGTNSTRLPARRYLLHLRQSPKQQQPRPRTPVVKPVPGV